MLTTLKRMLGINQKCSKPESKKFQNERKNKTVH